MNMRLAIVGSREYSNYDETCEIIDFFAKRFKLTEIVSGGARGADTLGKRYAVEHEISYKEFPALWDTYGKRAGFLRNRQIVEYSDMILAFWNGSKGTKNTIDICKELQKRYYIIKV